MLLGPQKPDPVLDSKQEKHTLFLTNFTAYSFIENMLFYTSAIVLWI